MQFEGFKDFHLCLLKFLVPGFVTLFVVVEPGPLREALVTKVALVRLVS